MTDFEKAFAAARNAGKAEFVFHGKLYHTRIKGELPLGPTGAVLSIADRVKAFIKSAIHIHKH